jgi:membrane protease YdiL (CAAX protease family)
MWYKLVCFTIIVLGISFAFAWIRLKSGSLWTAMFIHGNHNLYIQRVFPSLTENTEMTHYFTGEFGSALAIMTLIVAFIFWSMRSQLNLIPGKAR